MVLQYAAFRSGVALGNIIVVTQQRFSTFFFFHACGCAIVCTCPVWAVRIGGWRWRRWISADPMPRPHVLARHTGRAKTSTGDRTRAWVCNALGTSQHACSAVVLGSQQAKCSRVTTITRRSVWAITLCWRTPWHRTGTQWRAKLAWNVLQFHIQLVVATWWIRSEWFLVVAQHLLGEGKA